MATAIDWRTLLVDGYEPLKVGQKVFRMLPRDPRCKLCRSPFAGVGGKVVGLIGRRPSRKSPSLCQACFDRLPSGGLELDIGVVFADVRGSTGMAERSSPTEFARRLNRFYATATDVLVRHDAVVDKLIGDEVMALFIPGMAGTDYRRKAALAAVRLGAALNDVPVGVAACAGVAFVGNVGSGTVMDFTALGAAVNLGARLQSHAAEGQVVLTADLHDLIATEHPHARSEQIMVRGRTEPVEVRVLPATI